MFKGYQETLGAAVAPAKPAPKTEANLLDKILGIGQMAFKGFTDYEKIKNERKQISATARAKAEALIRREAPRQSFFGMSRPTGTPMPVARAGFDFTPILLIGGVGLGAMLLLGRKK